MKPFLTLAPLALALLTANVHASYYTQNTEQQRIYFPDEVRPLVEDFVAPSSTKSLEPGQKIDHLFDRQFNGTEATIQKLGDQTYWIGVNYYSATVIINEAGVLVIDPLGDHRIDPLIEAIKSLTDKPITAIMYSHYHLDHVGGGNQLKEAIEREYPGVGPLRIISGKQVAKKINEHSVVNEQGIREPKVPAPNEVYDLTRPQRVKFGSRYIHLIAPIGSGHTPDNTLIMIPEDRVVHFADMINPDQLPFYNFAGAENFHGYEKDLSSLLGKRLSSHWDFINGGHGNIGSKQDVKALLTYIEDLRTEVGKQLEIAPYTPLESDGNHFIWAKRWQDEITSKVQDALEPKYGDKYGFSSGVVETHAAMVLSDMIDH
ncbi:MBL fold metallo-hydrolase [Shewanella psychropiezotolerans]|uniref:MBL fold metallo-hydrolase n=1 Tax=Shewanella psychropiezotolerans TaxID=2593655 RepID=A0ABX5WSG8_9GAMM|nr:MULTISPECIES: MBL fold metallo-hydrolase [Shewanella]MPY25346.1 MBL fold metallo-hydrolase [Shewanella sp. YLB-07]QDO82016.1 MBL fold metallo-hydrolase [Shewanella psychropiezotolerans]